MTSRLLAFAVAGLVLGCGHSIGPGLADNHPTGFDFREPCCTPAPAPADPAPEDAVVVGYLGAGGLYVGWRGAAILTGPFFSNPGVVEVGLRPMRLRWGAIREALDGVPLERVGAILVGHSHYDHLGDLPVIAGHLAPWTRVYVNGSGADALLPYPRLRERVVVFESRSGEWLDLTDAAGRPLPFRVRAVPSRHAPHVDHLTLWTKPTRPSSRPWRQRRYWNLGAGETYALVIDLLGPPGDGPAGSAPVRFRIHYQDSASEAPHGIPPPDLLDRPYDLAVTVMASAHLVKPYPEDLLRAIRPRHVLVTHYEDFFEPWERSRGFVTFLTRRRAGAFLRRLEGSLPQSGTAAPEGASDPCGPSDPGWTMPVVGEWLVFERSEGQEESTRPGEE